MKKICAVLLAIMLMIFAVVPAFAARVISPSAEDQYDIVINNNNGGVGSYITEIIDGKKYVTLTAESKDGFKFTHWDITGEYVVVEGSLDSERVVIMLESDCEATPNYEGVTVEVPTQVPTQNTGNVSPQTGDNSSYVFLFVGLFIAVAGFAGIKLAKSKK